MLAGQIPLLNFFAYLLILLYLLLDLLISLPHPLLIVIVRLVSFHAAAAHRLKIIGYLD